MRSGLRIPCAIALSFALGMMVESARGSRAEKDEPRVTGVGGFFFKAQNPAKFAEWYRVHLGIAFMAGGKGDNAPQFGMFEWLEKDHPDQQGVTVWSIFPANTKYFEPSAASFMMNFRVGDLDRLLGELRKEGVAVDGETSAESNGKFGWAMDPEGNRIELWEPKGE